MWRSVSWKIAHAKYISCISPTQHVAWQMLWSRYGCATILTCVWTNIMVESYHTISLNTIECLIEYSKVIDYMEIIEFEFKTVKLEVNRFEFSFISKQSTHHVALRKFKQPKVIARMLSHARFNNKQCLFSKIIRPWNWSRRNNRLNFSNWKVGNCRNLESQINVLKCYVM